MPADPKWCPLTHKPLTHSPALGFHVLPVSSIPLFCGLVPLSHLKAFFFFFLHWSASPLGGPLTGFSHLQSFLHASADGSFSLSAFPWLSNLLFASISSLSLVPDCASPMTAYNQINVKHCVGFTNPTAWAPWRVSGSSEKLWGTASGTLSTPRPWSKPWQTTKVAWPPF